MCARSFSHVWLFVTPWTVAHQVSLFMGFSRHEMEWVAISSRGPSRPSDQTGSPALQVDSLPSRPGSLFKKVCLVKAMVLPVVMYGWELDYQESWVPKNWCFWTVVLEKTLECPCTARRSNQSILKEISPEYSLEGLMLKLKLQYFGHLMLRADSFEKTLMLGKIEGRRRGWQMK